MDLIRFYGFTHSLLINNMLEGIIWPLYILCNLFEHMPDFFSNDRVVKDKTPKTKFVVSSHQNLEPRRLMINSNKSVSKLIFINETVKKPIVDI